MFMLFGASLHHRAPGQEASVLALALEASALALVTYGKLRSGPRPCTVCGRYLLYKTSFLSFNQASAVNSHESLTDASITTVHSSI